MALYAIHLRDNAPQSIAGAEFVCQAFSWKAFFFGPFWLLSNGLWAGLALWTAAYLLLAEAAITFISSWASASIALVLQVLLGLEASRLREAKLAAKGYRLVEIVAARASDEAEIAFYRHFDLADGALGPIPSEARGGSS